MPPKPHTPPTLIVRPPAPLDRPQRLDLRARIGKRTRVMATLDVTPAGLLAIGGLVSGILLSTAVLVRASRRDDDAPTLPAPGRQRLIGDGR